MSTHGPLFDQLAYTSLRPTAPTVIASAARAGDVSQASSAEFPAAATTTFWQRLWAAIERHGQRRAAAELRRIASHHVFSDPEMTRHLLAAANQAERA